MMLLGGGRPTDATTEAPSDSVGRFLRGGVTLSDDAGGTDSLTNRGSFSTECERVVRNVSELLMTRIRPPAFSAEEGVFRGSTRRLEDS